MDFPSQHQVMYGPPVAQQWPSTPAPTPQPSQLYTQVVNGQTIQYQLMPVGQPAPSYTMPAQAMFAPHQPPSAYAQLSMSAPASHGGYQYTTMQQHQPPSTSVYQQQPPIQSPQPYQPVYDTMQRQSSVAPTFDPSRSLAMPTPVPQQAPLLQQSVLGPPQPAEQTEIFSPLYTGHLVPGETGKAEPAPAPQQPATPQSPRHPLPPQRSAHDSASGRGRRGGRPGQRGGRGGGFSWRRTEIVARDDAERANKEVGLRMKELLRGSTPLEIEPDVEETDASKTIDLDGDDLIVTSTGERPLKIARTGGPTSDEIEVSDHSNGSSAKATSSSLIDLLDQHVLALQAQLDTARSLVEIARTAEAAYSSQKQRRGGGGKGHDPTALRNGVQAYLGHLTSLLEGKSVEGGDKSWTGLATQGVLRGHKQLERLIAERMRGPPPKVQTIAEVVAASREPPAPVIAKAVPSTTPCETPPPTTTPVETPPVPAVEAETEAAAPAPALITPAAEVVTTPSAAAACVQSEMSIEEASVKAIEVALRNRNRANANASQAIKDELLGVGGGKGRANKRKSAAV